MLPVLLYYHRTLKLIINHLPLLLLLASSGCSVAQSVSIPQPENIKSRQRLAQAFVPSIVQDKQGFIWMATRDGLCRYDGNHFKVFQPSIDGRPGIASFSLLGLRIDQKGRIWVFSDRNDVDIVGPLKETFRNVSQQPFFKKAFANEVIDAHFIDNKGRLWLSFLSDKIVCFDFTATHFQQYKRPPIPGYFPTFSLFAQDQPGTIGMVNKTGLCFGTSVLYQFDLSTRQITSIPFPLKRTVHCTWSDPVMPRSTDPAGRVWAVTDSLAMSYQNNQWKLFPYPIRTRKTPGGVEGQILQVVADAQALWMITRPYNQNYITVGFAALPYNRQAKISYRYQLEGLDEDWIETNQPLVHYTDLRWGTYTLKLNASNTSGKWSDNIRLLTLTIRPLWWAILLYIAGLLTIIYVLVRSYLRQQEAKQLKEIDVIKARFFKNITHEFKIPLMHILAPIETLRQRLQTNEDQQQLDLINQNATQLINLVNQLMELSKAEAHILKLNESQSDLVAFVSQLVQSFEPKAATQGIELVFENENMDSDYWFDHEKLELILSNLVSNALKFTPVGGKISVHLTSFSKSNATSEPTVVANRPAWIRLTVWDNGLGITPDKLPFIFNRFSQIDTPDTHVTADSGNQYPDQKGMGIGLALVKELVEFQSGTVQVESTAKAGTVFTVELPYRSSPSPTPLSLPLLEQPATNESKPGSKTEVQPEEVTSDQAPVLVLVEDHIVLREFIVSCLPASYQIHQANNGQEGLELALSLMPDMVISDVLMPVMDGYTLCDHLKKDPQTSHIPIILLTAKSSVDSRLEGLALGADDYIAKPFHVQEFRLRVRNLLEQRRQLKRWFLTSLTSPEPLSDAPVPTDPLIERLCQIIEQHLDDTAFGAEELTVASNMSRMNLHRKLKALTDTSTGEFIRNYRLKRAAQFLRQGYTVSETAYLVGFEDPSYFARSFRKVYNMTPSTFSKRN